VCHECFITTVRPFNHHLSEENTCLLKTTNQTTMSTWHTQFLLLKSQLKESF